MSPTYQWQQDAGSGFVNMTNAGPFSGVTTATLTITGVSATMNGNHYRCLIWSGPEGSSWCSDTTVSALLSTTTGLNNALIDHQVAIFPNPAQTFVNVGFNANMAATITMANSLGEVIYRLHTVGNTEKIDITNLPVGVYIIKLELDGNVYIRRFIKI
jgi:hypothetical protein